MPRKIEYTPLADVDSDRAELHPGTSETPKKTFEIDVVTVSNLRFWLGVFMGIMVVALLIQYASFFAASSRWLGSETRTIEGLSRVNALGTIFAIISFVSALFIVTQLPRELGYSIKSTLGYTIVSSVVFFTSRNSPAVFDFSLPLGMLALGFWLIIAASFALMDHQRKQENLNL